MTTTLRVLAVPVTAIVVLVGLWVAGGLVTNDFRIAMWLAAGWMALAGLVALGIAARRRMLRGPVLGTYVVTALAIGVYLGSSVFMDNVVDEDVAVAAPPPAVAPATPPAGKPASPEPQNALLAAGGFEAVRHAARGDARVIELGTGGRVLTLTDFAVDNGPDLRVYLVAGQAASEGEVSDLVDLGGLKGNVGNQQYGLADSVDLGRYSTVVIWCRAFSVLFARAPLERSK